MLHDKSFISVLNGLGNDLVFYISAIDIIILKSTVSSGNLRFPHKALDLHEIIFVGNIQKRLGNLPAVDTVDHIFYAVVSGTGKLHLTVLDIFKGDFRMGKRQLLHQSIDVTGFCHIGFQEFAPCRCIVKEVSDQKCCSLRCPHFLQRLFFSAFDHITGTTDPGRSLCDQLHLGDGGNTGKCFTTEAKRGNVGQVFYFFNFTCGMAEKSKRNLLCIHSGAIVRDTDQLFSAVCDLYSNSGSTCVNGIFHKLFYNRGGALYDLSCCDLINGILV